jgi:hypothetical protein
MYSRFCHDGSERYGSTDRNGIHWVDIQQIKRANSDAGFYWFEPDALRFFRSRVSETTYCGKGGIFFVSSEKGPHTERAYTVRQFLPDTGDITTCGPFNVLSRAVAHRNAKELAKG